MEDLISIFFMRTFPGELEKCAEKKVYWLSRLSECVRQFDNGIFLSHWGGRKVGKTFCPPVIPSKSIESQTRRWQKDRNFLYVYFLLFNSNESTSHSARFRPGDRRCDWLSSGLLQRRFHERANHTLPHKLFKWKAICRMFIKISKVFMFNLISFISFWKKRIEWKCSACWRRWTENV